MPLKHPWRYPVRCSAFVSLYTPEAKSTLETQQLDSAAAIWLVSNKWLLARFVTIWSIKFRKSLFSFTADIGKDLGTCLGIEGTCWTWMRKKKSPQTGGWRKTWMEDGVMIPCAGVWKKASHLRHQIISLPANTANMRLHYDGNLMWMHLLLL